LRPDPFLRPSDVSAVGADVCDVGESAAEFVKGLSAATSRGGCRACFRGRLFSIFLMLCKSCVGDFAEARALRKPVRQQARPGGG